MSTSTTSNSPFTTSPAPTSPVDDDPTPTPNYSFFNAGGSTLILALLAVGLFVGGLLVMLSMRRYVYQHRRRMRRWGDHSWDWDEGATGSTPTVALIVRRHRDVVPKPQLWDASVAALDGDRWEDVTPICAKIGYLDTTTSIGSAFENFSLEAPAAPPRSQTGFFYPFRVGLHDFATQISALRPRPRNPGDSLLSPSQSFPQGRTAPQTDATTRTDATEPTCVQVTFAITLPVERPCETGVPLFALGVTEVRWNGKSG